MDEWDDYYSDFENTMEDDYSYGATDTYGDFQNSSVQEADIQDYSAPNSYDQMDYQDPGPGPAPSQPLFSDDEGWAPEGDPQIHEEADSWAPLGDPQEHIPADEKGEEGGGTRPLNRSGYPAPGSRGKDSNPMGKDRGYGGSSRSSAGDVARVTQPIRPLNTQPVLPPNKPTVPTLTMPARDPARIRQLVQEAAAPATRGLRDQYRRVMAQHFDNPNVRRMTLREAMSGYGAGLDKVFGGARQYATQQYEHEYADKSTEAKANWQAQVNAENEAYRQAWADWARNYGQRSYTDVDAGNPLNTSQPVYKYYTGGYGRNTL